jgi:hypothetical protein
MRCSVIVILVACVAGSCWGCSTSTGVRAPTSTRAPHQEDKVDILDYPALGIRVVLSSGKVTFELKVCTDPQEATAVTWLSVEDDGKVICEVEREPVPGALISNWQYGSDANGFRAKKTCETLLKSHRYTVCASGGGEGCVDFELDAQGVPHSLKESCH